MGQDAGGLMHGGMMLGERRAGLPLSSSDIICIQRETPCAIPVAKVVRNVQRIMNLRLFECRRFIFTE
jgi:hypothetical protein